ncbi:MFS transporter [Streptomyces sp. TRM 70361]|uniref:MFS transporter n=1 Tax=Streptomyces sp. TRM 70361 TaxID=3116553 RepID=UPI002E7AF14C|nr:MFS transporter [Streptomyces sp. TRM 70361]MEE1937851.1 MFS transporter [Streptomyces sp. TRM 70361]
MPQPAPEHPTAPCPEPRAAKRPPGPSGSPARFLTPYARLLAVPGATAFTLAGLLARLPMGMLSISAIIMIADRRGSYALAGAVTATGLAATAVVAPLTARLVDRHGQARVAVPAVLLAVGGSLALLLCVRYGAPDWTLFAAYAATATTPNTGGMARARWAHLFGGGPDGEGRDGEGPDGEAARHTANSFEQALDELCFVLGPVLAGLLCATLFPEAGTLTGAVLLLTGTLLFAAQRRTEPPVAPRGGHSRTAGPPLVAGLSPLLAVFLATGAVFGSLEVVTVAYADELGHRSAAGAVLALQAVGSGAAGLVFGTLRLAAGTVAVRRRLVVCAGAMAVLMALPLLTAAGGGGLLLLAPALLVAGMATAPAMVTGMTLVQRLTPAARLNEGMTLIVTVLLGGIAAGSAAGGWTAEHLGGPWGYTVPPAAAALAAVTALGAYRARRR